MNIELTLVLIGLLIFGVFAWHRWMGEADKEDSQHLKVFANLGCVFVIIGFGSLIIQTLTNLN